jgi:AMMECR1 domain-containing protein
MALMAAGLIVAFANAAAADDLAVWRDLARGPAGARLLAIARASLEAEASAPDSAVAASDGRDSIRWPAPPAALYLTLVHGIATRSCVGEEPPHGADVAEAVRALAVQALVGDRRRAPVRRTELAELRIVLGFAGPGVPIADPMQVDPGRQGLRIATERGSVAFLPGEARTVDWALREARRIGVLSGPRSAARYFRFSVVTLSEAARSAVRMEASDESR